MVKSMYNSNMTFEWNDEKNLQNIQKHDIAFEEAQDAFFDEHRIIVEDKKHIQNLKEGISV
jgi:uncharacterized DUF497 family protein